MTEDYCYSVSVCVLSKLCQNPNAWCDSVSRWVFGRCFGHEDGVLVSGISAFVKQPPKESLSHLCNEDTVRSHDHHPPPWHPDLRCPTSTTMRNRFLLLMSHHPACGIGYPIERYFNKRSKKMYHCLKTLGYFLFFLNPVRQNWDFLQICF